MPKSDSRHPNWNANVAQSNFILHAPHNYYQNEGDSAKCLCRLRLTNLHLLMIIATFIWQLIATSFLVFENNRFLFEFGILFIEYAIENNGQSLRPTTLTLALHRLERALATDSIRHLLPSAAHCYAGCTAHGNTIFSSTRKDIAQHSICLYVGAWMRTRYEAVSF